MKRFLLNLIFFGFVLILGVSFSASEADGFSLKTFKIPPEYGSIKEICESSALNPLIIHIQDAHCNYEAQKNLSKILEYLIKEHSLRLILVEGGSGDVGLSFLRNYADKKTREEVADRYLMMGKISGEEYLDIISDYTLDLYGIDDDRLYDSHLASFWKIDAVKTRGLKYLQALNKVTENLKPFLYSTELRHFEKKKNDYEEKKISLVEYSRYLVEIAGKKQLSSKNYPYLSAFSEVARLEKELDFEEAQKQRNAFIKALAVLLDEKGVKELLERSQKFKTGEIGQREYYSYLVEAAENKVDIKKDYPALHSFMVYTDKSKGLNARVLLEEINLTEEKIKEKIFSNNEEKQLNQVTNHVRILISLLNLEMTPQDYGYFRKNKNRFSTSSWIDFLRGECEKFGLQMTEGNPEVIDQNLDKFQEFYKIGFAREKAFIKNITGKMKGSGEKIAVLITGGFHTPGITRMLKEQEFPYIVVTPVITKESDSNVYFTVLKSQSITEEANLGEEDYDD